MLALCLLSAASPASSVASDGTGIPVGAVTAETRAGRLVIFEEVWETVRARYYDPALGGVDWRAAREEFRPAALSARGATEFYAVLRRMLTSLRDPHTRVHAPGENTDWREVRHISVGVTVREVLGEVLITRVERGSDAERAGLRAGDSLLSVDGEPAPSVIARLVEERSPEAAPPRSARAPRTAVAASVRASTRLIAASRLFDGAQGSFVTVVFRSDERGERSVRLRREWRTRAPSLVARREGGFGVVSFNLFTSETAARFARALRDELRGARGFVVDLRENGGGDSEAMTDVASLFLPPGRSLGKFTDRSGRVHVEPHTRAALLSTADVPASTGVPLVLLTGARTSSAAEVLAAAMRESGRAVVIGETTCGCVLGIRRRHKLPDGGILDVSETDYRTAGGARLEGAGLKPDEEISLTRRDLQSGRDSALMRAFEILKTTKR